MTKADYIEKINQNLEHLTKDELKDVSILTTAQLGVRLKVAEKEYIEKEIANLTSQLQQQALPVVPECVGEYIEKFRKSNAFHSIKNLVSGDEYYTYPGLSDEVKNWISENIAHQELLVRAWINGYTVQKPKRFYLKNKLTGKYLRSYSGLSMDDTTLRYEDVENKKACGFGGGTTFTQEEIDSMQTGSYEKIEVEE